MSALVAIALQSGLPIIERILAKKLGDANGNLASTVIRAVAERAGATPETIEAVAVETPGRVIEAMREVERASPEILAAYDRDLQLQLASLAAEQDEAPWVRAWRPAGMYLLGFLWLWNIVLLHVANAIFRTALPPMPFDNLIQLSGLYMGLYMGGHTVKDLASKWVGSK